jgi:hypothetical protein
MSTQCAAAGPQNGTGKALNVRVPFTCGDPLTALLIGRWQLRPWFIAGAYVLIVNVPLIILGFIDGFLLSQGGRIGLLQDYSWWVYQLLSIPATVTFFFWMPAGICHVLEDLRKNAVIGPSVQTNEQPRGFNAFIQRFDRVYSHWIWAAMSLVCIGVFAVVLVAPALYHYSAWNTSGLFVFWYRIFYWFVNFFLVALIVLRGLIVIWWFNKLFKEFEIEVTILHPDGAGGLSPLGAFTAKVGYLIGIYGLAVMISSLTEAYLLTGRFSGLIFNTPLSIGIATYLILAPFCYFAPIGTAHSSMKRAKDHDVLQIARQFQADFGSIKSLLDSDAETMKRKLEKVEQLEKLHSLVSRFPVWPFDIGNLVRFFSSVLLPLILGLIPTIIDILRGA